MRSSQKPFKGSIYLCQDVERLASKSRKSYEPKIVRRKTFLSTVNITSCTKPVNSYSSKTFQNHHLETKIYLGSSIFSRNSINLRRACKMCLPQNKKYRTYLVRDLTPNGTILNNWDEGVSITSYNSDGFYQNDHLYSQIDDLKSQILKEIQHQNKIMEMKCSQERTCFGMADTLRSGNAIKEYQHRFPVIGDSSMKNDKINKDGLVSASKALGRPLLRSRSVFSLHSPKIDDYKFENYPLRRNLHTKDLSKTNNITRNPKYFEIMDFNNEAKNKLRKSIERLKKKKKLLIPVMKEEIHHWKKKRAMEENREETKSKMQIWDYKRLRLRKNTESEVTSLQNILAEKEFKKLQNDEKMSLIYNSLKKDSEIDGDNPIWDPISILKDKKDKRQFKILGVQPHLYKKTFKECIKEKETNKIKEKFDRMPLLVNSKRKTENLESPVNDFIDTKTKSNPEEAQNSEVSYASYVAGYQGKAGFVSNTLPSNKSSLLPDSETKQLDERPREPAGEDKFSKEKPDQVHPVKITDPTLVGKNNVNYIEELTNPYTNKEKIDNENEFKYIISKLKKLNLKSEYSKQFKEKYQESSETNGGFAESSKNTVSSYMFSTNMQSENHNHSDLSIKSSTPSTANTSWWQKSLEMKDKYFTKDNQKNEQINNRQANDSSATVQSKTKNSSIYQLTCSKEKATENSTSFPPSKEFLSNIFYDWFPGLNVERQNVADKANKFRYKVDQIEKKTTHSLRHNKLFHQSSMLKIAFTVLEKVSSFSEFTLTILRAFPASAARGIRHMLSHYGNTSNNKDKNQASGLVPWGNLSFLKKQILSSIKNINSMKNQFGNTRKNISYKCLNLKTSSPDDIKNRKAKKFQPEQKFVSQNPSLKINYEQRKMASLLNVIKHMQKEAMVEKRMRKPFSLQYPQEKSIINKNYVKPVMNNSDESNRRRLPKTVKNMFPKTLVSQNIQENSQNSFYNKRSTEKTPKRNKIFKTSNGNKITKAKEGDKVFKNNKQDLLRNPSEANQITEQSLASLKNVLFPQTVGKNLNKGTTHPESNWQSEKDPSANPFLIYLKNKNEEFL